MNLVTTVVEEAAIGVTMAEDVSGLSTFLQPECSVAIWHRQTPTDTQSWLDGLDPEALPYGRVVLPIHAVSDTLKHLFDTAGLPAGPERDWLHDDICRLADVFSELLSARFLRMRLDVVTTNACRKFHIDAITARLVCTYRGTGTQYGISEDGEAPARISTVPTGSPILLRGTLWPAKPASGLLHRSPPIEGTGETRLVLVLDPVSDPDDEL